MNTTKIYHNPRCSKSRQALAILQAKEVNPEIILYLDAALSGDMLQDLIDRYAGDAIDFVRTKDVRKDGLAVPDRDSDIIKLLVSKPRYLERPIVDHGTRVVLGRPPENVLELFE